MGQQVLLQRPGIAGLKVAVQQNARRGAVGHRQHPHALTGQILRQRPLHVGIPAAAHTGQEQPVVAAAKVRGGKRIRQVYRMQVLADIFLGRVALTIPGGGIVRALGAGFFLFRFLPGGGRLRRGGDHGFGGLAVIEEILQRLDIHRPVGIVHQAVVHAGAHAVGALQRHGKLFHLRPQEPGQLHQQGRDLGFGEVGLHQRQHGIEQVVQLGDAGVFDLVQHRRDHGALALDALPVVVDLAQARVLQRRVSVEVVQPRGHLVDDEHGVGGHFPVEGLGFQVGDLDVHAAHGVHDLHKGVEIHADIVVHLHVEAVLHGVHRQLGPAVAESMGDPVILALIPVQQDRHAGAALDGDQFDGVLPDVQRDQDQRVGPGIGAELGSILGAVQLVEVGEGVGVVDCLGALVGTDQQDVEHVLIGKGAALGHLHLPVVMYQAGGVQVLVFAGVNGPDLADAAVAVAQQVQLAVHIQRRHPRQRQQDRRQGQQDLAPARQFSARFLRFSRFDRRGFRFFFRRVHIRFPFCFKRRSAARGSQA